MEKENSGMRQTIDDMNEAMIKLSTSVTNEHGWTVTLTMCHVQSDLNVHQTLLQSLDEWTSIEKSSCKALNSWFVHMYVFPKSIFRLLLPRSRILFCENRE